jgi:tetratricopeptide (TPR) repeat protein
MANNHYKAFISYNHADVRWAQWIHRALERYRVPARLVAQHRLAGNRLHPVFRDRDELSSSSSLSAAIQAALQASENLIVVCSPAAAGSRWVNEEIKVFQALGRGERIFCLIVDGDAGACFPPALADDEPLGADVRSQADGRTGAKLKIISGLLGIPFGELKDREHRRRARFFAVATAASIALAGVMTALAISAVLAGREAERNRALATRSLADAEAVASFLSTMLTDIDPEAIGKTIVDDLRAQGGGVGVPSGVNGTNTATLVLDRHLLEKASKEVQTQFSGQPAINARLDKSIGASYQAIGLYGKAIERTRHAVELYQMAFGPTDERTLLARNQLAEAYFYDGQLDEAAAGYVAVLDTGRAALGRSSEPALSAMNGLGMVFVDMDRAAEARKLLEEAATLVDEALGPEHPHTLDVKNNLGWTLYVLKDFAAAELVLTENLAVQRRVNGPQSKQTLSALNNLALAYTATGRLREAEAAHREEWSIGRRVLGDDHPEVLISMLNLGRVLLAAGKRDDAEKLLADALVKARTSLPPVHPLLASISTTVGEIALAKGRRDEARALFLQTRHIYEQMFEPGHRRLKHIDELLAQSRP